MATQTASLLPLVFNGEHYHIWAVEIKAYLRGQGLWQYVEEEKQPPQLGPNPTLNQIRLHEEEASKAQRALSHIHSVVTDLVFIRIMACETTTESWDKFREEFIRSDITRNMQVLNLRREFETLRMQEAKIVKEYVDRLMNIVNKIRLLGLEMTVKRIVEKVIVSLPEIFEAKISSLEDSKDLSRITLTELVHALQAQELRRLLRQEDASEGAMLAAHKGKSTEGNNKRFVGEEKGKERSNAQWNKTGGMKNFPPCSHYKKKGHAENRCWFSLGIQCRAYK
ncbi:uncharacterized protein LOC116135317 [Pistacia vera]|uniref:uncharacterized protein LOC116135317 n=1 Tax=Pistacia vera TaxID=55513 RepID=UPI001263E674|nr:uncharacterized protein LOC116135317 [Pistacia vera]